MKRVLSVTLITMLMGLWTSHGSAVELLGNPDLEDATESPWTLTENPSPENTAEVVGFAAHAGAQGLWLREFEGLFFGNNNEMTDAVLSQIVPGTAGLSYTFSGWSRWETNYSGGVTTLDASSPSGAVPSPTDTFMEMRFLNAAMTGISAVHLDLRTEQLNDGMWRQHVLSDVAPAGTAHVMVVAGALDMIPNVDPGQSAFFDDFSLMAVPEPGSCVLALLSLAGLALRREHI